MKKILALSLFAMVALVYAKPCTSGGSPILCNWDGNGEKCWQIKSTDDKGVEVGCETQAGYCPKMYKGPEASNGSCSGGGRTPFTCDGCSWGEEASVYCDYGPLLADGTGGCWEKPVGECTGGKEVTKQQCDERNDAGVTTANLCYWEGDGGDNECYCGLVAGSEANDENCTSKYGQIVTDCTGMCSGGGGGGTPTLKYTPANQNLIVSTFGRSLHISSAKGAMVSLYDMSGAKVYSGRVSAGNRVFSLERVPSGSYYAVVQAGSSSKKVSVILK